MDKKTIEVFDLSCEITVLFNKARSRDSGDVLPRETLRKGRIITVWPLIKGAPMVMNNNDGTLTRTSTIQTFYFENNRLIVITENTIYELFLIN